jgi:hypothetical protein
MSDLVLSMRLWSGRQRNRAFWFAFAGATLLSVALTWKLGSVFQEPDSNQYLAMANHQKDLVTRHPHRSGFCASAASLDRP